MKNWKSLLMDNLGLKLISLTLAFVLWFVVISIDDPVDEKSFNNIKVNFVNTHVLTDNNKVFEVLDSTDMVRTITFEAPDSIRKEIEASDFIAEADFDNITNADTVEIRFSCPKYSSQVTNISGNISFVKLNVEEKARKSIDIKYNLIGEVADGYMINSTILDQNRLEVVGPKSKIEEIVRAYVDVNVEGISNDITTSLDVYLVDKEGRVLDYDIVSKSVDNIRATVDIYTLKEVPVAFSLGGDLVEGFAVIGEPAEGYMRTGMVDITPETVVIAGNPGAVNNFACIAVPAEEIDITDVTENYTTTVNLRKYLTNGIIFADRSFDGKAEITVYIEEVAERSIELDKEDISIINVPEGLVAIYPEELNNPAVVIQGLNEDVMAVNRLNGTIDVAAWMEEKEYETLSTGFHELPVTFEIPDEVEQAKDVTVMIEFVTPEQHSARSSERSALQ